MPELNAPSMPKGMCPSSNVLQKAEGSRYSARQQPAFETLNVQDTSTCLFTPEIPWMEEIRDPMFLSKWKEELMEIAATGARKILQLRFRA